MQASQRLNKLKIICLTPLKVSRRLLTGRASSRQRVIAGIIFLAIVASFGFLWSAASGKIDIGRWLGPCGFKQRYGLPCPTCGITASALVFTQGKFFESLYIHPAGALLCSVLVITGFLAFLTSIFGVYFDFLKRFFSEVKIRYIILALIIIIVAGWAVTLARALAAK